jgi:2'-5' RNA ligase
MFFDSPTENIILKMWGKLAEHGISTEIRASGIRPHITLAVYEQLDCRDCEKRLAGLSERLDQLEIQATHLGIFFQPEAVLFLAPSVTEQLLDFHARVIETLKQDTGSCWDIYLPGNWVPHCTLAINLELEDLNRQFPCAVA